MCWTLPVLKPRARSAAALLLSAGLVLSASGCAPSKAPPANAGGTGIRISTNTPQGVRAKQVMDMLNSDWPIGAPGVRTLAAPDQVDYVATVMDGMWWERPYTVAGADVGAGTATLHLVTSYGARQDIDIHTNDATAFALGRAMIAIIENYQNDDNTVTVPEALRPYLAGREVL